MGVRLEGEILREQFPGTFVFLDRGQHIRAIALVGELRKNVAQTVGGFLVQAGILMAGELGEGQSRAVFQSCTRTATAAR